MEAVIARLKEALESPTRVEADRPTVFQTMNGEMDPWMKRSRGGSSDLGA